MLAAGRWCWVSDEPTGGDVVAFPVGKRGYSWPPFEEGNRAAVKHGAWSPSVTEPRAGDLVDQIVEMATAEGSSTPWLAEPSYRLSLLALARTEVRIERISAWLIERGSELKGDGDTVGASNTLSKLEARAESLRSKLGLDPTSRARLGRDVAAGRVDMARLMSGAGEGDG